MPLYRVQIEDVDHRPGQERRGRFFTVYIDEHGGSIQTGWLVWRFSMKWDRQ